MNCKDHEVKESDFYDLLAVNPFAVPHLVRIGVRAMDLWRAENAANPGAVDLQWCKMGLEKAIRLYAEWLHLK